MPSNKALREQITDLCLELNIGLITDGLNNAQLAELVSDLKAKKTDAETATAADDAAPIEHEAGEVGAALMGDAAEEAKGFFIAGGKSLTSKRGILGPGEEVKPEDFSDGSETIARFVKSGHIVKVG